VERSRIWAFDEIHHADANVYRPRSVGELAALVAEAAKRRRPITVRGGGKSLGQQSLGTSVVLVDHPAFQWIADRVEQEGSDLYLTCGAGARWGEVVRKISDWGIVPRTVVTTGDATVGGTSVVDGISRMSPLVGKEGQQIRRFKMIDGRGLVRAFDRPQDPEFRAAITGFGAVGVMTEVTFRVARAIPGYRRRPDVETEGARYMPGTYSFQDLLGSITRQAADWGTKARRYFAGSTFDRWDVAKERGKNPIIGMSVVGWLSGEGLAFDRLVHRYVHDVPGRRIPGGLYTEDSAVAQFGEKLAGYSDTLTQIISSAGFPNGTYVDELCGFLFFLGNGTVPAIRSVRETGGRLNFVQQTYVVPTPLRPTGDYDVDLTRQFLELTLARCREREVRPFSVELTHLGHDDGFLSATRDLTGFAVTITFADHDEREWPFIQQVLMALSHDLLALGGRVHLVKNVEIGPDDLRAMYAEGFREFKKVKDRLDPFGIFSSEFYRRYFAGWSPA
jgi:hypothetical protein